MPKLVWVPFVARSISELLAQYTVTPSGCHEWDGNRLPAGYGIITRRTQAGKTTLLAHRAQWERHNGAIPAGLVVMHACDNPSCINPDHLKLGTYQDNSDDMRAKGRHPSKGSRRSGHRRVQAPCSHCAKVFPAIARIVARCGRVYCSNACAHVGRRAQIKARWAVLNAQPSVE